MRFLVFFSIWFIVMGLAHWYVGRRIISAARFNNNGKRLAWGIVLLLFLTPLVPFFLFINRFQGSWLDVLSWVGYFVLGFFTLVLTFVLLRDIVMLVSKGVEAARARLVGTRGESVPPEIDRDRRRFLIHASNVSFLGLAAAASGYGFIEARHRVRREDIQIALPDLPLEFDGFRIVQFSDLHVGPTIKREFVEEVTESILNAKPDLIAFTGDLVDGSVAWLKDDVAPLRELQAPYGMFFVTGNHEYYSGVDQWVRHAGVLGFDVLMNEHRLIAKESAQIILAGVTDYGAAEFTPAQRSDPQAALALAPDNAIRILMAHQPRSIHAAAAAGVHLQLSGHTHGGQYFPGNYLARLAQPYIKGLHTHGNTQIYVNRGIGYWGPPLRIGAPPELSVITLRKA